MNDKYRMYVTSLAIRFQRDAEVARNADADICRFASGLASRCYMELSRLNSEGVEQPTKDVL